MVVCLCNQITDCQIKKGIESGITSVEELRIKLGIGAHCACCVETAEKYINEYQNGNCENWDDESFILNSIL